MPGVDGRCQRAFLAHVHQAESMQYGLICVLRKDASLATLGDSILSG